MRKCKKIGLWLINLWLGKFWLLSSKVQSQLDLDKFGFWLNIMKLEFGEFFQGWIWVGWVKNRI